MNLVKHELVYVGLFWVLYEFTSQISWLPTSMSLPAEHIMDFQKSIPFSIQIHLKTFRETNAPKSWDEFQFSRIHVFFSKPNAKDDKWIIYDESLCIFILESSFELIMYIWTTKLHVFLIKYVYYTCSFVFINHNFGFLVFVYFFNEWTWT